MNNREWNPGRLFKTSGNYWLSCAIHAAVKLDVFTAIGLEKIAGEGIAQKINGDTRAVSMLCNALVAMGLLDKKDDKYANTSFSQSFLSKGSPQYSGNIIMHHHFMVESWTKLDQAVRTGNPVRTRASRGEEERLESFIMGMFNLAMNLAPQLVAQVDLSGRRHLLDLGGGPGTYAIHFCQSNPQLKATVYDLPTTRPFAQKTIDKFDLNDRIQFINGDYTEEDIKGVYDVAWLSHILHAEGPEGCQQLIEKAVSVLEPGGIIFIHEFILNNTMDSPLHPALFSLNMLLGNSCGQSYSENQLMDMLEKAGVKDIKRHPFQSYNDSGIIYGVLP
ncbi:methyltransferase [Acidobacteriota bacterium]